MTNKDGNFEIVRASAGSGKTYRLVLMYLECALQYDNPRAFKRILALTFTNKAAAEMKSRILEDLEDLVNGESDKQDALCKSLDISSQELINRSTHLHKEMLHRYSDISVMTIDKFVNKLVKSFARDLALEQDYRIEIDSKKVLEDAVSQLLDKIGTPGNKDLTALLKSFALSKVDDDQDSSVRSPLTKLGVTLMQEKMKGVIDVLSEIDPSEFKKISEGLWHDTRKAEAHFYNLVDVAIEEVEKSDIAEWLPKKASISKLLNDLRWVKIVGPTTTFDKYVEDPVKMVDEDAPSDIKQKAEDLHEHIEKVHSCLQTLTPETSNGKRHILAKKLNKRMALMGTLAALHQEIENVQIDNNIRTFHAMHERISDIVKENHAPFIYERMGERYYHIFMDEFQDTSITQWHNLVVLYDHAMSNQHRTLVVGDGKQAIYRFRNGDYKQLMDLPKLQPGYLGEAIKNAERTFSRENNSSTLDDNYRSGRKIVEWNNSLFEAMSEFISPELKEVYSNLKQTPKTEFNGGVYLDYAIGGNKEVRREVYAEKIIDRIKQYDELGYDRGDITILVRDNETGSYIAQALLSNNIKPQTEESLQLGRHPGPLAVVSLMRWLLRPKDYRQSANILQCACAMTPSLNEAEILEDVVEIENRNTVFQTEKMLELLFPGLNLNTSGPLASFIGHACDAMGITDKYPAYAEGMMELATKVSGSDESGIHGFLRVWDQKGKEKSIVTSTSKDSVQIMTIHKAKGLAFKIVITIVPPRKFNSLSGIIPVDLTVGEGLSIDAAMMDNGDMKNTILEPQMEEELSRVLLDNINVTYVALTRPVERLDVILGLEKMEFKKPVNMSQLLVWALQKVYNSDVAPGDQTTDFTAKEKDSEKSVEYDSLHPSNFTTGERIDQLVVSSGSEATKSQPQYMSPRELGLEVHRILESIENIGDWRNIKKTFEGGMSIGEEDKKTVISRVESVLQGEETKSYFKEGLHVETEQSFVNSNGKILRPDRIIKAGEDWTIIDYKSSEEGIEKHKNQVEEYCEVLSEIEGPNVRGIIIYTDPLKVLKVV